MPRVNPNQSQSPNPAKFFIEWSGKDGRFSYYDKAEKKSVQIPDEAMIFIVLDELNTIKGWDSGSDSGIYSNEVRNLSKEVLHIKSFKGGLIATGLYEKIGDSAKVVGGKFAKAVYAAIKVENALQIACMSFYGSSLGGWFDFTKENKAELYAKAVKFSGTTAAKKGSNDYLIPKFSLIEVSQETNDKAGELQELLQAYHNEYFEKGLIHEEASTTDYAPDPNAPENTFQEDNGLELLDPKYISQEEIDKNMAGESPPLPF